MDPMTIGIAAGAQLIGQLMQQEFNKAEEEKRKAEEERLRKIRDQQSAINTRAENQRLAMATLGDRTQTGLGNMQQGFANALQMPRFG